VQQASGIVFVVNPWVILFMIWMADRLTIKTAFHEGRLLYMLLSAGGLWCSVLWPCIVPSALSGLGKYVNQGMTFIMMSVLGAALIPYLQGRLADKPSVGIHLSYIIPAICFAYLIFYALIVNVS